MTCETGLHGQEHDPIIDPPNLIPISDSVADITGPYLNAIAGDMVPSSLACFPDIGKFQNCCFSKEPNPNFEQCCEKQQQRSGWLATE
jgi:hypothetical protein